MFDAAVESRPSHVIVLIEFHGTSTSMDSSVPLVAVRCSKTLAVRVLIGVIVMTLVTVPVEPSALISVPLTFMRTRVTSPETTLRIVVTTTLPKISAFATVTLESCVIEASLGFVAEVYEREYDDDGNETLCHAGL